MKPRPAEPSAMSDPTTGDDGPPEARRPGARPFTWGFVSQGFSSATSLGLSVLAARGLGSGGLGVVAIAFITYVMVLGLGRALVTQPMVTVSSHLPSGRRKHVTEEMFAVFLLGAVASTVVTAVVGVVCQGDVGRALLIVAPWLAVLLIQDFWRTVLFRDGRPRAAAANDAAWLVAMALVAPIAWQIDSPWAFVACWAFGGAVGTLLGIGQTRCVPRRLRSAMRWWRLEIWPLARWLGAQGVVYWIGAYGAVLILVALVGTAGLGGYRAVTTIFSPLTLVSAALTLPGLPAISRERRVSREAAFALSTRLGLLSVIVTGVYIGILGIGVGSVVPRVFGASFESFEYLLWPVGVTQLVSAVGVGFALLLLAEGRGAALLTLTAIGSVASLTLLVVFGELYGLKGAAWALAGSAALGTVLVFVLARRAPAPGRLERT